MLPIEAESSFKKALEQDRQGNYLQAIAHYQSAIASYPDYAEAYNNIGCVFFKLDRLERAVEYFQQGLVRDPLRAELHNNLAQAYVTLGQWDQAIAAYEQAIRCQSGMALAHHNLGRLWHYHHHYERAIACFKAAIDHEPEAIACYNDCAQVFLDWGKPTDSLAYLQQVIRLQPQFVEGYCHMVEHQRIRDPLDHARHACVEFLRLLQRQAAVPTTLKAWANTYRAFGDVSFMYERYDQAGKYYERSLQLHHQPDLWERLADSLASMGQEDAAILYYHQALQFPHATDTVGIHLKLAQLLEQGFPESAADYYHQICHQAAGSSLRPTLTLPPKPYSHFNLPSRTYVSTADWIADTAVEGVRYIPVNWGTDSPVQPSVTASIPILPDYKAFMPQCGGVSCGSCMAQLCHQFQSQWVEEKVYQCTGRSHSVQFSPNLADPPAFVVTIPRGRAWIAPQQNSWLICNAIAIMTPDHGLLGDLSRCYPWYLPGCSKHDFSHHRLFFQQNLPPVVQLKGKVVILSCLAGHVYYHWMFDLLPRLEILRRSGIVLQDIDWFVVNNTNQGFQRETLARLGIPSQKIIVSDDCSHVQADHLIVPSFPGHMDWVPSATLNWSRQIFLPSEPQSARARLYLSRSSASYRQVINEKELGDRLSSLGFITIRPETLSVEAQAQLFAQADIVVAPHGSGLTNLAFCPPGTRVVELFAPDYVRTDYWIISQRLHLEHYYVIGETFDCELLRRLMDPNPLTENIYIDPAAIEGILTLLINQSKNQRSLTRK
ncbi:MAG: glycosyltransferase 61 family protein [Leptolyngbyaceae bacterium]|nr:glycosyltransferase 61 family protein [Leptolyngbyaceae bacterium]